MRVLVVEDNTTLADGLQRGLIAEGFSVDVAHDGAEGLWRAREMPYDLIILDIMLPVMNGYDVCRALRSDGSTVPILMLTAKSGEFDEADGLDVGADDYLRKPFSFVVLVARVRALLRRGGAVRVSDDLEFHGLVLDLRRHTCRYGETTLELTPREFSLLGVLMSAPDVPHTRADLLDRVWGHDIDQATNVVEVYIGYLRRKLAAATEGAVGVETIRNVGYRMRSEDRR